MDLSDEKANPLNFQPNSKFERSVTDPNPIQLLTKPALFGLEVGTLGLSKEENGLSPEFIYLFVFGKSCSLN